MQPYQNFIMTKLIKNASNLFGVVAEKFHLIQWKNVKKNVIVIK